MPGLYDEVLSLSGDPLAQQIRSQWGTSGSWDIAGYDRAAELAQLLSARGITSLDQLSNAQISPFAGAYGVTNDGSNWRTASDWEAAANAWDAELAANPSAFSWGPGGDRTPRNPYRAGSGGGAGMAPNVLTYGNGQTLGYLGDANNDGTFGNNSSSWLQNENLIGWSAQGHGNVSYVAQQNPQTGRVEIVPRWGTSSAANEAQDLLVGAAAVYGGGYGFDSLMAGGGALGAGSGASAGAGSGGGSGLGAGLGAGGGAGAGAGAGSGAVTAGASASPFAGFTPAAGELTGAGVLTGGVPSASIPGFATPTLGASGAAASGLESLSSYLTPNNIRGGLDVLSGLYGMNLASNARQASDPFAPYRDDYAKKLLELENNPNLITRLPGWQAGLEAIQRQMGSQGYLNSGNHSAVLSRYAGEFTNQTLNRYATLAGANQTPGAGQFQSADLAGRSLASLGYGLSRFLSPGG